MCTYNTYLGAMKCAVIEFSVAISFILATSALVLLVSWFLSRGKK